MLENLKSFRFILRITFWRNFWDTWYNKLCVLFFNGKPQMKLTLAEIEALQQILRTVTYEILT